MKARRANVELGLLGAWYLLAGIAALAKTDEPPRFGAQAVILGVRWSSAARPA